MTSPFRDCSRTLLQSELVCPCGEDNRPGRPDAIVIDDLIERAGCRTCGRYGPVAAFLRPSLKEPD